MRLAFLPIALLVAACGSSTPEPTEPTPALHNDGAADGTAVTTPEAEEPVEAAATARVNVNTADEAALKAIPGVTERMAHEFEEYRPYVSITQFRAEIGKYVDEATVAGYEQHIYVPIEYNDCDAATLMQVPGIDAEIAAQLIAGRPFASADEFTTMVEAVASNDAGIAAAAMLASQ